MSSYGQKVTSDPEAKRPVGEAGGVITSDSLAGESVRQGGAFGEGNERVNVSEQPSYSTTTNTTDTSGARQLDPAVDAEARQARGEWNEAKQLDSTIGQGKEGGRGPTWNITSGSGDDREGNSGGSGRGYSGGDSSSYSTGGSNFEGNAGTKQYDSSDRSSNSYGESTVDSAPKYVDAQRAPIQYTSETGKPHGRNITEGGFDSDAPNASFNTTDIGGPDDPGRRAMQNREERIAGDSGYPRDTGSSGEGRYGALDEERA